MDTAPQAMCALMQKAMMGVRFSPGSAAPHSVFVKYRFTIAYLIQGSVNKYRATSMMIHGQAQTFEEEVSGGSGSSEISGVPSPLFSPLLVELGPSLLSGDGDIGQCWNLYRTMLATRYYNIDAWMMTATASATHHIIIETSKKKKRLDLKFSFCCTSSGKIGGISVLWPVPVDV